MTPAESPPDLSIIDELGEPTASGDYLESEERAQRRARFRLELESRSQDIAERKKYADRIYRMVRRWLVLVVTIVVADGIHIPGVTPWFSFDLSDATIIALITTTTASVVGILLIVMNYLFPKRP